VSHNQYGSDDEILHHDSTQFVFEPVGGQSVQIGRLIVSVSAIFWIVFGSLVGSWQAEPVQG
jgi:hypothetical protein